jgi:hypothetical protein
MTVFLPNAAGGAPSFAESDRNDLVPAKPQVVAVEKAPKEIHTYRFPQMFFPLDDGRTLLRLNHPLSLMLDKRSMVFEVKDWGIFMETAKAHELPNQIARRFLTLFGKADSQTLTEEEKIQWLKICDQVDVAQFNVDRSAPHYMEGKVKRKSPLTVEWHDGTSEQLPARLAANFHPLETGDNFSAFVKMGKANVSLAIERLTILPV